MIKAIAKRKSIRSFMDKKVEPEKVESLLRAAMRAPSGINGQPWEFIVVDDRAVLSAMQKLSPGGRALQTAPLAIVVCGETTWMGGAENPYWQQDCAAATQNILLAVEALGLGAVWTGVYPNKDLYPKLHDFLNLPSNVQPFCCIPIGHPAGNDQPKDKWKPENIHYGKW